MAALTPQLAQIEARVAQLGPEDKASENAEIAAQRKALAKERSEVDSAVKQGKLLSVEASQAAGQIEAMRNRQFSAQIFRKVASPLTPAFWRELASEAWEPFLPTLSEGVFASRWIGRHAPPEDEGPR